MDGKRLKANIVFLLIKLWAWNLPETRAQQEASIVLIETEMYFGYKCNRGLCILISFACSNEIKIVLRDKSIFSRAGYD